MLRELRHHFSSLLLPPDDRSVTAPMPACISAALWLPLMHGVSAIHITKNPVTSVMTVLLTILLTCNKDNTWYCMLILPAVRPPLTHMYEACYVTGSSTVSIMAQEDTLSYILWVPPPHSPSSIVTVVTLHERFGHAVMTFHRGSCGVGGGGSEVTTRRLRFRFISMLSVNAPRSPKSL